MTEKILHLPLTTIPEMVRWEIPTLNLICHVNPDNEIIYIMRLYKSITWVPSYIGIHSVQPLSRLY